MKRTDSEIDAIVSGYCADVLSGARPACRWVKMACQRRLDDLERAKSGTWDYRYDQTAGARIIRFIELLRHTKGPLAGQPMRLEPWQMFILAEVFGWRNREGHRRYRRAYVEVPRGNGKSSLLSGVMLYCLCADGDLGAQCDSFATTRDQAKIVWQDAKVMAERNPALCKKFGLQCTANALFVPSTNSTARARSADAKTLDGAALSLGIIDELHAHTTREVYDVVETGLGKRPSSLLFCITTAGVDLNGICFEVRTLVSKVLKREVVDETQFGVIYGLDDEDLAVPRGEDGKPLSGVVPAWQTEAALRKANPNWGVSVEPVSVKALQKKASVVLSAKNNFLTKHLDVWCNAGQAWIDLTAWNALADPTLQMSDFEGCEAVIGLDLASKVDLAAVSTVFERDGHYYVFGRYYTPSARLDVSGKAEYRGWAEEGYITTTPGQTIDFETIKGDIAEIYQRYAVREIGYDPWQATWLAKELSDAGAQMVEVRQTVKELSEPMKQLEKLILDGRIHHDGNPALTWMASNVYAEEDKKGNIYPRKLKNENKIDGIVALIIALSRISVKDDSASFDEFLNEPLTMSW